MTTVRHRGRALPVQGLRPIISQKQSSVVERVWGMHGVEGGRLYDEQPALDVDVAVVCASYNARWQDEWCQSVYNAFCDSGLKVGIVVVDDCSTDDSLDVWRRYLEYYWPNRPRCLIRLRRNVGPGAARNIGVRQLTSRCKWLLFLDADDRLSGDGVTRLLVEARKREADAAWGMADFDEDGVLSERPRWYPQECFQRKAANRILLEGTRNPIPLLAAVVRRRAFEAVGGFDEALGHCADWDLWLRMCENGAKMEPVQVPVATYRVREGQLSRSATMEAGFAHVPQRAQWRREAQMLRLEHPKRSLAVLQYRWATGGAQAALLQAAEGMVHRGWSATSVSLAASEDHLAERFRRVGELQVVTERDLREALSSHTARYTWQGDLVPAGTGTTHIYFGGDCAWHRQPPPAWARGIYCSEWLREYLEAARGEKDAHGVVIPNPVDVAGIGQAVGRDQMRDWLCIEPEAFVFLWCGRVVGVKNPGAFARAAARVLQGGYSRPVYFVMAGPLYTPAFAMEVQEEIARVDMGRWWRLLGNVPSEIMPLVYHAADALIISSHFEGMSLAMLEGMAAGLPILATDVGGAREALGASGGGQIVPRGSEASLADAMLGLFFNPPAAREMGRAAKRQAGLFDVRTWADRHEIAFLREVVS